MPGLCNYLVPFFQFLTAHTGVELPDNRTGCLSPSSVGEQVGLLGGGANTHQLGCFIIAACYHHCCLDFWLINYHQVATVLHFARLTASRYAPSAVGSLIPSAKTVKRQNRKRNKTEQKLKHSPFSYCISMHHTENSSFKTLDKMMILCALHGSKYTYTR